MQEWPNEEFPTVEETQLRFDSSVFFAGPERWESKVDIDLDCSKVEDVLETSEVTSHLPLSTFSFAADVGEPEFPRIDAI